MDSRELRRLGKVGEASLAEGDFVFAVSDGMGGARAGEFASRITVEKLAEWLPKSFKLGAMGLHRGGPDYLAEVLSNIHAEMVSLGFHYEECRGMGATLSLLWFGPVRAHFVHVGDSRIYLQRAGEKELRQVSEDHTYVQHLVRTGRISTSQAKLHPQRNLLTQTLGGQTRVLQPQLGTIYLQPGDRFVLCTDGVTGAVGDRSIAALAHAPNPNRKEPNPADRLVEEALSNLTRDNSTAMVVEVV